MYKFTGIALILLLLLGCSDSGKNPNNNEQSPLPSPNAGSASASPELSASPEPTSSEQTEVYLDKGKLKAIFGFTDGEGKQLLVTGQNEGEEKLMVQLNSAIGENGNVLSIDFVKKQTVNELNNGRDTAQNFNNLDGYLFTIEEGKAAPDQTYYLVDRADFNTKSLLTIHSLNADEGSTEVEASVKKEITAAQQRDIEEIWKFADIPDKGQLFLVQFLKQEKNMLFSFVLIEGDQLTFMNYPATTEEEYSVWRVDDGGKISPDMFSILFAAETSAGMVLGLHWLGAEGVNSFLLEQVGDSFKEMGIEYSRYTSPL
ncbi:hypothetical protein [Paenibacillus wynnii]|uniref:Lipoprotein n=1 Tax=Paenibacillus wynnii TaxID=268407 RepID=A0A098M4U6_9BACL|nr:hypothetical protein [Paenibacillus wynnii]KGE16572.1 hypothetical protein PWYN_17810 [Paenibacillus wynnii]